MRLSLLYFLFCGVLSCETAPNAEALSAPSKESDVSIVEKRKAKNSEATFSVDEIREPSQPSSLPGLEQVAVKERMRTSFSIYKKGTYTAISPSGLRMRDKPSLTADVVGKVPYLGMVSIVDIYKVVKDTLNKDAKYKGYSHSHLDKNIPGDWVLVNYEGNEAYVFSAYLTYGFPNWDSKPWRHKDYAINSISKDCILEIHENPEMNWYGVFKKEDGFFMKPIQMSYRILHQKNMLSSCIVNATPSKNLGLCFGTLKEVDTQWLDMTASWIKLEYDSLYEPKFAKLKDSSKEKLKALNLDVQKSGGDGFELVLTDGEISQVLEKGLNLEPYWPETIHLAGDIDQDGKMDFYINYISHDSIGDAILYLSSEAREGEIVRPVAINQRGYCD